MKELASTLQKCEGEERLRKPQIGREQVDMTAKYSVRLWIVSWV